MDGTHRLVSVGGDFECNRGFSPTALRARLLGFDSEVLPVRFLSLGITIMFALTALAASKQVSAQSSSERDKRELERLEKVWNEAHEHGDADVLQSLWADDIEVDVPKMPVMSKTEIMAFARSGRMKFLRYATSDINIRVYGDAAVVTGRLQRTRTLNGQELSDDWRFTKVYTRHAQTWRVVSFHASEAAKPN
jgi:ketosteroid isomerase-like protein